MIVLIGHGPSIMGKNLGGWLDQQTIVRMKTIKTPNKRDFGSRTDFMCNTNPSSNVVDCDFWLLSAKEFKRVAKAERPNVKRLDPSWFDYFKSFNPKFKPSTGMRAIFAAVQFLDPEEIGLAGFDRLRDPDGNSGRFLSAEGYYAHDAHAERRCAESLGLRLTFLT